MLQHVFQGVTTPQFPLHNGNILGKVTGHHCHLDSHGHQGISSFIQNEIGGPGILRGYRAVWHSLRLNHHIHVPRHKVASILRELNPEATEQRRSRRLSRRRYLSYGPNFCWHVDGMFFPDIF